MGDTQRTEVFQLFYGKEWNRGKESRQLLEEIRARSPEFLILAGDMVTYGHAEWDWKYFESLTQGLPLLPVAGNHDYFFMKELARQKLKRFPEFETRTWYHRIHGPLALMILDSNRRVLGSIWEEQKKWFAKTLASLESDSQVKGILVVSHHPPFTNSQDVNPHKPTQEDLLPIFFASRKALAYVTGHCHAYERFEVSGKTFIVSGGGGGPRQRLLQGSEQRYPDLFRGEALRPFHYLWLSFTPEGLNVEVRGFMKKETTIRPLESFQLPWRNP